MSDDHFDDEQLLVDLGDAVRTARAVPDRFIDLGKDAFTWLGIDYELATLSYDSAIDGLPAGVRADTSALRMVTFVAGELTVEVELSVDAVVGQLVPPQRGRAELRGHETNTREVAIDDSGWFEFRPAPTEPIRLCVRTDDGRVVLTRSITPGAARE